jgi:hypothetical protein
MDSDLGLAPCRLVAVYQRFGGTCRPHRHPDDVK